ncbi:MAG TPA: alpha/beta hydrolase-fold protein [Oleiagrimonas sp.]|nr:alpha/beta hydrolase-fold protein [Oleiagrimonas sp.]
MFDHPIRRLHTLFLIALLAGFGLAACATPAHADGIKPLPEVPAGKLVRLDRFPSQYVAPHNIDVWLPPGYPKQAPYAVLYMMDGQNLFGQRSQGLKSWRAAATAAKLIASGKTRPFIIVGIWHAQTLRMSEYFPQKPWQSMTAAQRRSQLERRLGTFQILPVAPYSDAFLKFVTQELKPAIDKRFAVASGQENTFVMGSSMGALIAWYAMSEYPKVFGGAACLSTHWPGAYLSLNADSHDPSPDAFIHYIGKHFPSPARHKIYFDHGTETLDAYYGPIQKRVDALLQSKGWTGSHFESRVFPGASHNETSWAARLAIPMTFLLAPANH